MCQQIAPITYVTNSVSSAASRGCLNSPETFFPVIRSPGYVMLKVPSAEASF